MPNSLIVIRVSANQWDASSLRTECKKLCKITEYKQSALHEDAPRRTNCVTALNFVLWRAFYFFLPSVWVGNMPKSMSKKGCEVLKIEPEGLETGDLLFVKEKKEQNRLVTHVAVAISAKEIFHCCRVEKRALIESPDQFFARYNQAQSVDQLISYKDPRENRLLPSRSSGALFKAPESVAIQASKL